MGDMNRVASTSSARARAREHVLRGCAKRVRNFTERRGVHRRPQIRGRDLLGRVGAANKEDVSEVSTTSSQKASVSAESVVRGMYEAIEERNTRGGRAIQIFVRIHSQRFGFCGGRDNRRGRELEVCGRGLARRDKRSCLSKHERLFVLSHL